LQWSGKSSVALLVYLAAMPDFDYENNQTIIFNRGDEPVIAHSISPKLSESLTT